MDLFAQIGAGSSKLKKVDREKIAKEKAASRPASGGIMGALQAAISKNRNKIAASDSDDDSDWSDSD